MHMAHEMSEWSNSALHESILDAVMANIAILNGKGEIIAVNDAWVRFAEIHELALDDFGLGLNYLSFCDDHRQSRGAAEAAAGLRGLLAGEASPFRLEYPLTLAGDAMWVRMTATRISHEEKSLLIVAHEDITVQRHAQAALGRATAALLHAEDDERRRIARELHDGTAQYLTGAKLMLGGLKVDGRADKVRLEVEALLTNALEEIRSLSYVLHPPALEELGLGPALRQMAEGFARRTGLALRIDIAADLPKMARATEIALYRVAQEALANVHRHSGSSSAAIGLRQAGEMALLSIRDYGVGLSDSALSAAGVGLASMRLRLEFVNGHISMTSAVPGLLIEAWAPLPPKGV
uniref:Histidine kinase n=1 Tax=Caulobacter sp. (strain K31) TaxID=366602 RepID=B0SWH9_CAUSK